MKEEQEKQEKKMKEEQEKQKKLQVYHPPLPSDIDIVMNIKE